MAKKESDEIEEKAKEIYACMVCKKMFKKAGLCPNCNLVLKKAAG